MYVSPRNVNKMSIITNKAVVMPNDFFSSGVSKNFIFYVLKAVALLNNLIILLKPDALAQIGTVSFFKNLTGCKNLVGL